MAQLRKQSQQSKVQAFALRINLPVSKVKRVEVRVDFLDRASLDHLMNCLEADAFGAKRGREVAPSSKPILQVRDDMSKSLSPKEPEDEITRHRRETLEILEGTRQQHKLRDYPKTGILKKAFDAYAAQEKRLIQRNAQVNEAKAALDKSPVFTWTFFHQVLTTLLTEADCARFPQCRRELKPIILRLDPRKGEPGPFFRVQNARNVEGASMVQWKTLLINIDQHGWENYVLWLGDPEHDVPSLIRSKSNTLVAVTISDNLI